MNKKGGVSWGFVIKLIVALAVIALVIWFIMTSAWPPVVFLRESIQELLERSQPKPYTSTELIDKEAKDSINALLYSVNRLAWFDTHLGSDKWDWDEETDIKEILDNPFTYFNPKERTFDSLESWGNFRRDYGETKVIPTIRDDYIIYPRPRIGPSNPVEAISDSIARNVVDCYAMFKDKLYTDTRCFTLDFAYLDDLEINKQDIIDALINYMEDDSCDDKCEDIIDDLLGWNKGTFLGLDPWENIKFKIQGNKITKAHSFESEPPKQVYICSQEEDLWNFVRFVKVKKLYITDDNSKCLTPADGLKFNFIIQNFNLPQEIRSLSDDFKFVEIATRLGSIAGGGILGASSPTQYIGAYGDPKYIVFYEKFPKGEDSTWKTSMLGEFGKSLGWNSFFLLLNFVPIVGPYLSAVLTTLPGSDFVSDLITDTAEFVDSGYKPGKLVTTGENIVENVPDLAESMMEKINTDDNVEARHTIKDYIVIKTIGNEVLDKNFVKLTEKFELELNKEDFVKNYDEVVLGYKNVELINEDQTVNSEFKDDLRTSYNDLLLNVDEIKKQEVLTKLLDEGLFPLMESLVYEYLFYYDVAVSANELLLNTNGITPGSRSVSELEPGSHGQIQKCSVTVQDRIDYLCNCDGCEGNIETEGTEVYDLAYGDSEEFACLYLDVEDKDISLCDVNFQKGSYCDNYNSDGDLYNPNGGFCSNNLKICPDEFVLNDHDYCMCGPYKVTSSATDTIDEKESEVVFLMPGETGYCCANEFYASEEELPDNLDDDCNPVVTTSEIDSDSRKVYVENYITQNKDYYEELKQKEKLEIKRIHNIILVMALEEQEVNQELGNAFGFSSSDLRKDYDSLIKSFYLIFERTITTPDDPEMSVETQYLMSELVLSALRIQSISRKFYYYGTNTIGFKTPYKATVVYDDKFTKNWVWPQDDDKYLDYFDHFGGYIQDECDSCNECQDKCRNNCEDCTDKCNKDCEKPCDKCNEAIEKYDTKRYRGLLREVDRYYLSLIKDKRSILKQPDQRFHLVSPCKADLIIRVTHCECYGTPVSDESVVKQKLRQFPWVSQVLLDMPVYFETGEYNDYIDSYIENFDGKNKMLYSLDEKGHIVKECGRKTVPFGEVELPDWMLKEAPYTPLCMEIDPLLNDRTFFNTEEDEPNYCYRGLKPAQLGVADTTLNYALPIFCFFQFGGPVSPVTGGLASAICSVAGNLAYSIYESKCYHWPHHGNSIMC